MHEHKFIATPGALRDAKHVGVQRCSVCGLITHQEDVSKMVSYQSGSMREWNVGRKLDKIQSEDTRRRVFAVAGLMEKMKHPRSYLDFGCGDGDVVREMRLIEPSSFGYDLDVSRVQKEVLESKAFFSSIEEIGERKFSVVSAFHVVEHVYDVVELLKLMGSLLAPGGYLVIETPNAQDALISLYDSSFFRNFTFWSHHPSLCTSLFLEEAIKDVGLSLEESANLQRYGLANHLHWLIEGKPGGHKELRSLISEDSEARYRGLLAEKGVGDTLWLVAKNLKS